MRRKNPSPPVDKQESGAAARRGTGKKGVRRGRRRMAGQVRDFMAAYGWVSICWTMAPADAIFQPESAAIVKSGPI